MEKHYIDGVRVKEEEFKERFDDEVANFSDEELDDYIDNTYDALNINGNVFYPSRVVKELDNLYYMNDLRDEYLEIKYQDKLEDLDLNGITKINGIYFEKRD